MTCPSHQITMTGGGPAGADACAWCADLAELAAVRSRRDALAVEVETITAIMDGLYRTGGPGSLAEQVYRLRERVRDLIRSVEVHRAKNGHETHTVNPDILHDLGRIIDGQR